MLNRQTTAQLEEVFHDWLWWGRTEQHPPPGDWWAWVYLAGRGAGKTRAGAEWIRDQVRQGRKLLGMIAPTAGDARRVMVEGESGLLSVSWAGDPMGLPIYEPSNVRVIWPAVGAVAYLYSAAEPERLRGPQHEGIWADEIGAWRNAQATWDMAKMGLRLGPSPRIVATTTPRPTKLMKEMLIKPSTVITRGSTFDNADNLAPSFLAELRKDYEGTRLGRQELYAEILTEAEGALWTFEMLEAARWVDQPLPQMKRVVIAIDPAITANEESDETGLMAVGLGVDDTGYVLEDGTGRFSPSAWGDRAVKMFHRWGADRIVAEGNQGGDMVRHVIQTCWPAAPVKIVYASRGKAARAEPIVALYEQRRVRHVARNLTALEDQLVTWEPLMGMESPGRLDALVWGLTDLMLGKMPPPPTRTSRVSGMI